jgi:hypothetical protein
MLVYEQNQSEKKGAISWLEGGKISVNICKTIYWLMCLAENCRGVSNLKRKLCSRFRQ